MWYVYGLIGVLANSAMVLCFRKLQRIYPIEVYLFYVWVGASATLIPMMERESFAFIGTDGWIFVLVAGVASWVGNYAYNKGLRLQPNAGYVETLSSVRVLFAYALSLVLFDGQFNLLRLAGVVGIMFGVAIVGEGRGRNVGPTDHSWSSWSLVSGAMFGILATANKAAFEKGLSVPVVTGGFLLIAAVLYALTALCRNSSLRPRGNIKILLLAVTLAAVGNLALSASYRDAPNLGYPVAISSSRAILLYLIALVEGTGRLDVRRGIGILLAIGSAALLA